MIYSLPCTVFETARPYILYPLFQKHPSCWEYYTLIPRPHPAFCCLQYRSNGKPGGACMGTRLGSESQYVHFCSSSRLQYKVKLSSNEMIKILDLNLSCSGEKVLVATT